MLAVSARDGNTDTQRPMEIAPPLDGSAQQRNFQGHHHSGHGFIAVPMRCWQWPNETHQRFGRLHDVCASARLLKIRADFVALLAEAIETAAINGSGSSSQPTGILQTSGIDSVAGGTKGLSPTLDHMLDLRREVSLDNANVGFYGFLANTKVEAVLANAKDSQSQYLLNPYVTELGRS